MADGTFTATGASLPLGIGSERNVAISLSGTFVARVQLQEAIGTAGWRNVASWSAPISTDFEVADNAYRLFCDSYTSGTVTYSLSTGEEESAQSDDAGTATRLWTPSDTVGSFDMAAELEAFVAANQGFRVTVPDNAIILLNNAFKLVTTGNIDIDFGNATILYDNNTSNDAAIFCDNVANAGAEATVSSIALATVNDDATVTQITLSGTAAGARFDWFAFYSTDANPGKSGGQLGEIVQLLKDEATLVLTCTRRLNRHEQYATVMRVRKLDKTRKVHISGGTFTANGNTQDHLITNRCTAIWIRGFVDPHVERVTFERPWSTGIRFQACAAPRLDNYVVRDVGNLGDYNGFTYGCTLYGMVDAADIQHGVVRNARHPGFTTDGNSNGSSTWYNKGIPTNFRVNGIHGYNCHGSIVDTHEEGDGGHISNIQGWYSYQDEDITPNFSGAVATSRCARTRYSNIHCYGGTNGIKVTAIDHGFEDQVHLDDIHVHRTTKGASTDNDIGINIADQSSLTNKRHVILDRSTFNDVGKVIALGKTAKLTVGNVTVRRCDTWCDNQPGSLYVALGTVSFDFRDNPRTAGYNCHLVRSDGTVGGATVLYLRKPVIIKGTNTNSPTSFFLESDSTATKTIYCPGITEYNPSGVTATVLFTAGATSFAWAPITDSIHPAVRIHTAAGAATLADSDNVLEVNKSSGAATVVNLPSTPIANRRYIVKDGKGDAQTNNITLTPASGNIDGTTTKVINTNYGSMTIFYNGTEWKIEGDYNGGFVIADVQVFTSTNTWTKPTIGTARTVRVIGIGAGGGGGGGARTTLTNQSSGGGAGGGGDYLDKTFDAATIGATETVTIGAAGTGGAGATADGNAGSNGVAGGNTTFGSWLTAYGGGFGAGGQLGGNSGGGGGAGLRSAGGNASGSTAGVAGTSFGGAGGSAAAGSSGQSGGGAGGGGGTNGAASGAGGSGSTGAGGGGCGAGIDATGTQRSGSAGGSAGVVAGGAAGTGAGGAGSPGTAPNDYSQAGSSGGGGATNPAGVGGAGGAGVRGGGGGGGGSAIGGNGGVGGAGGSGYVVAITNF